MKNKGFTLIELLVVIAVIAMLMAILLPVTSRVRKQARAVACQSQLRQWGIAFAAYTEEHDGRFYPWWPPFSPVNKEDNRYCGHWAYTMRRYYRQNDLLLCPEATKRVTREEYDKPMARPASTCWLMIAMLQSGSFREYYGSYALNAWISKCDPPSDKPPCRPHWNALPPPNGVIVPLLIDSRATIAWSRHQEKWAPPEYEGAPWSRANEWMAAACTNRHSGNVNCLFTDWSARKVGLKELWALKWSKTYDTQGPWTKAGGVRSEDWPEWMRRFKDY